MIDAQPTATPPAPPKRGLLPYGFLLVFAAGAAVGARFLALAFATESTDDAFLDAHVVAVAPKVAGRVSEVRVESNQRVRRGDLLVLIDDTDISSQIDQAKATVAYAEVKLDEAGTAEKEAKAHLASTKAEAEAEDANANALEAIAANAERDVNRYRGLVQASALPAQEADHADSALASARARLESARGTAAAAKSKIGEAEAQLETKRAAAKAAAAQITLARVYARQLEINHSYTRLAAPADGIVANKSIEPGSYVQVGQSLMALVPDDVWVTANFKETQLADVRPGTPVTVKVDAWPDHPLEGVVASVQSGSGARFSLLPPENASGNYVKVVQRVPVRIELTKPPPAGLLLGPGMSVVPVVQVRPVGPLAVYEAVAAGSVLVSGLLILRRRKTVEPA